MHDPAYKKLFSRPRMVQQHVLDPRVERPLQPAGQPGVGAGREQGLAAGRREGLAAERALLCRQAARKFDDATARRLAERLADIDDRERLAQVGDGIVECGTAAELLARVAGEG